LYPFTRFLTSMALVVLSSMGLICDLLDDPAPTSVRSARRRTMSRRLWELADRRSAVAS
jgi:hypothetical protein